jgi:steroid delta-isomerase-like uncharacterized protein
MSDANKQIVQRWFDEVWNQGREDTIDDLLAPTAIAYGLGDTDLAVHGPAEFKPFVRNLRGGLPDLHIRVADRIAEGNKVVARIILEGTHTGGTLGVPPTGRRVRVAAIIVVRILNGQIVEGWNSWDQLGLLRQIGALPGPDTSDRFIASNS